MQINIDSRYNNPIIIHDDVIPSELVTIRDTMFQNIAIECHSLQRRYDDDTPVLECLDLRIGEGEFIALLGESGCGKTTFLRLLAGFDRPDAGSISVAGRTVVDDSTFVAPEHRRVGMVFQDYALFPHLTVAENIGYGLARANNKQERIQEVISLVGLAGLEGRMPSELSGGQQQRVALARALAPDPDVILLDEPFSNLDVSLRTRLRLEVREILRQAGTTTILVTHDQEEALSLADRVAVLRDGCIQQFAPPDALYRFPASREIAEFVGEANFLSGDALGDTVICGIGDLNIPLCKAVKGPVEVMIRPEWIELVPAENGEAEIVQRLYFGHDQLVLVRTDRGHMLHARLGPDLLPDRFKRVNIRITHPVIAYKRPEPA